MMPSLLALLVLAQTAAGGPAAAPPLSAASADEVSTSWLGWKLPKLQYSVNGHDVRLPFTLQTFMMHDEDPVAHKGQLSLTFRRLRTGVRANLFGGRLETNLQLNLVPGSAETMDAWMDVRIHPLVSVRVGQFTVPFGRFRHVSHSKMTAIDWPIVTRAFGAERQLGLAVHNGYSDLPRWGYALGVFHGTNARRSHGVGIVDTYAAPFEHHSSLVNPGAYDAAHPEVVARLSWASAGVDATTDSDDKGGPLRGLVALGGAYDFVPRRGIDAPLRLTVEGLAKWEGFALLAVGYLQTTELSSGAQEIAMLGLLGQLAYRLKIPLEFVLRYALVNTTRAAREDAIFTAEQLLEGATDADRAALTKRLKHAGAHLHQQELTLGVNTYFAAHGLKLQLDVSWLGDRTPELMKHDIRTRLQMQLAF